MGVEDLQSAHSFPKFRIRISGLKISLVGCLNSVLGQLIKTLEMRDFRTN